MIRDWLAIHEAANRERRPGVQAARMVQGGEFGRMLAFQDGRCLSVPLVDVAGRSRPVPDADELLNVAHELGVCLG